MTRIHGRYVCGAVLAGAAAAIVAGSAAQAAPAQTCSAVTANTASCLTTSVEGETFTQPIPADPADPADPGDPGVSATTAVNGLPFTGADIIPLVLTGGALFVGGASCLVVARRRRAV